MLGIIPYHVDVPMQRLPFANFLLLAIILVASVTFLMSVVDIAEGYPESMLLDGFALPGLFAHMFLHAGVFHMLGNMIFLWTFGNAVCAKIGNYAFIPLFILLGLVAACAHILFSDVPAIGASGAINGIVGMYLVLYPRNDISCFWFTIWRGGTIYLSSFWMILLWLFFDIWGAVFGGGGVAYWAHIGGFAAGFGLAYLGVSKGWIKMRSTEESLYHIFSGNKRSSLPSGESKRFPGTKKRTTSPF